MDDGVLTETRNSTVMINRLAFYRETSGLITVHEASSLQTKNLTDITFRRIAMLAGLAFSDEYSENRISLFEFSYSFSDTLDDAGGFVAENPREDGLILPGGEIASTESGGDDFDSNLERVRWTHFNILYDQILSCFPSNGGFASNNTRRRHSSLLLL